MTATVPFLFLGIMFIRGVTLDGAADGMLAFIRPDFGKLLTFQVKFIFIMKQNVHLFVQTLIIATF